MLAAAVTSLHQRTLFRKPPCLLVMLREQTNALTPLVPVPTSMLLNGRLGHCHSWQTGTGNRSHHNMTE